MTMRRSKLQIHIDVLKVLARQGPLKLTHIVCKANISFTALRSYLNFLVQHNLVEEEILRSKRHKTRAVYIITKKGLKALESFRDLIVAFQATDGTLKTPAMLFDQSIDPFGFQVEDESVT